MVEIPEGYTELELVGFTDKGSYTEGTSYVKNDLVHYGDSIYKCIVDNTVDVLPSNTSCWEVFILNHSNLDSIMAVDTEGKLGAKGEEVSAQQLVDKISKGTNQMVGATEESDGIGGIIPPPRAGDEDKALLGNGTWGKVDSIYKYKTEEEYNQAVANNEIPDGATVIKEWDEELSVIPVDSELSEESLNPLQNKVIAQKIAELNQSIEELNGLLGGKLDVSKIANNLITTEAGYALDARMGKALKDELVDNAALFNSHFCHFGGGGIETHKIALCTSYQILFIVANFDFAFAIVKFNNSLTPTIQYVFGDAGINISAIDPYKFNITANAYCQINIISNLPFTLE